MESNVSSDFETVFGKTVVICWFGSFPLISCSLDKMAPVLDKAEIEVDSTLVSVCDCLLSIAESNDPSDVGTASGKAVVISLFGSFPFLSSPSDEMESNLDAAWVEVDSIFACV